MVNEDDILLVSGGFSMDASQNSLAEHVAQMVDGGDQAQQDCSQLDHDHCVDTVHSGNALDAPVARSGMIHFLKGLSSAVVRACVLCMTNSLITYCSH